MTLSFRTDRGQTQIRLFAIPSASFGQKILWFSSFVLILGSLQQSFLASENLGTLQYSEY